MEELIAQITDKTGVTAEKAKEMVSVTAEWMRSKLPDDVAGQLGSLLASAGEVAGSATRKAAGAAAATTGRAADVWSTAKDTASGLAPGKDE